MKKRIAAATAAISTQYALAATAFAQFEEQAKQGVDSVTGGNSSGPSVETILRNVINAFLFVVGAVSVIMIIVGAFRYVISAGDSNAVNGAKNTILYAVVGLVIAISAYGIVTFVFNRI